MASPEPLAGSAREPVRLFARAAREPLLWFALAGAGLYLLAEWLDTRTDRVIRVPAAEVAQLAAFWRTQAHRPPTAAELAALVDERVDEEVLAREALVLGLDRDDVIVRRRLAQKLAFVNEETIAPAEPSEAQLRAWFTANAARYAVPDTYSFAHHYFSPERHGAATPTVARAALHQLTSGEAGNTADSAAGASLGDPFLLPTRYEGTTANELARDYGTAFVTALREVPLGRWAGPIDSALGAHLVFVERRVGARAPAFEAVRAQLRADYLDDARRDAARRWVAGLRENYHIEVEGFGAPGEPATP